MSRANCKRYISILSTTVWSKPTYDRVPRSTPTYPGLRDRGTTAHKYQPGKRGRETRTYFADALGAQHRSRVLPLLRRDVHPGALGTNHAVHDRVRNVDVLLPKLLREALRQRAHAELARGDDTRRRVPAQAGRRAREEERAALAPRLVDGEGLERGDGLAGEGERADDVGVDAFLDLFGRELEEWLVQNTQLGDARCDGAGGGPSRRRKRHSRARRGGAMRATAI